MALVVSVLGLASGLGLWFRVWWFGVRWFTVRDKGFGVKGLPVEGIVGPLNSWAFAKKASLFSRIPGNL